MPMFEKKEDIFELIEKFEKSALSEIEIDVYESVTISMKKQSAVQPQSAQSGHINYANQNNVVPISPQQQSMFTEIVANNLANLSSSGNAASESPDGGAGVAEGEIIKSPLIGVYYAAPSPDSEPFIKVGEKISKGSVLCIIEAMKVMNEIESEHEGEIAEIFVKNGDAVEYGQPLFRVKN